MDKKNKQRDWLGGGKGGNVQLHLSGGFKRGGGGGMGGIKSGHSNKKRKMEDLGITRS